MVASEPMASLTVWSFTAAAYTPTGTCVAQPDRVTCGERDALVDVREALVVAGSYHVTRFSCRVLGRDDQGELRCAAGKPTLDYDATEVLRAFGRKEALRVAHLWGAPAVVTQYLRTGDPKLRAAAEVAARNAARVAAFDGGREAGVEDAAWGAVWATKNNAGAVAQAAVWAAKSVGAYSDTAEAAARLSAQKRQSRRLARVLQAGAPKAR